MDESFFLMLSNLLHLQNSIDPKTSLISTTTTSSFPNPTFSYSSSPLRLPRLSSSSPSPPSSPSSPPPFPNPQPPSLQPPALPPPPCPSMPSGPLPPSTSGPSKPLSAKPSGAPSTASPISSSPSSYRSPAPHRLLQPLPPCRLRRRHGSLQPLPWLLGLNPRLLLLPRPLPRLQDHQHGHTPPRQQALPEFIKIPVSRRRLIETTQAFEGLTSLPNMCGAIDGSPIKLHKHNLPGNYKCKYGYPSILLEVVADHNKRERRERKGSVVRAT